MKLRLYQLDAFTDKLFAGNPAAVLPLEAWLSDELMQQIAAENNLAETAFYVQTETGFHIRWFTPVMEVDLCGHATLATAHVIFSLENYGEPEISFESRSGILKVTRQDDWLTLDFPADSYQVTVAPPALTESLKSLDSFDVYKGKSDYMIVVGKEAQVQELNPDIIVLSTVPYAGRYCHGSWRRSRFCVALLRAAIGYRRGPRHGFGAHDPHSFLGRETWEESHDGQAAIGPRGLPALRTRRQPYPYFRSGKVIPDRRNLRRIESAKLPHFRVLHQISG